MDTNTLYENWASTYDTDGNILQAVDDFQMHDWLPELVRNVQQGKENTDRRLVVMDFGCGTGRNTAKLLAANWDLSVDIVAWDGSQAMLNVAREKCNASKDAGQINEAVADLEFDVVDFADQKRFPKRYHGQIDGLISTLVLEHLPLDVYFEAIKELLRPGGYAIVSNMHDVMGRTTQAGYKTATGERLKGCSYIHGVDETTEAAKKAGLEVLDNAKEIEVHPAMIDGGEINGRPIEKGTVREGGRKWVGKKIWYGLMLKRPLE